MDPAERAEKAHDVGKLAEEFYMDQYCPAVSDMLDAAEEYVALHDDIRQGKCDGFVANPRRPKAPAVAKLGPAPAPAAGDAVVPLPPVPAIALPALAVPVALSAPPPFPAMPKLPAAPWPIVAAAKAAPAPSAGDGTPWFNWVLTPGDSRNKLVLNVHGGVRRLGVHCQCGARTTRTRCADDKHPDVGRPIGYLIAWWLAGGAGCKGKADHLALATFAHRGDPALRFEQRQAVRDWAKAQPLLADLMSRDLERPRRTGEGEEPIGLC